MSKSSNTQLILDVADELKTIPAFLEKDIYVSRILSILTKLKSNNYQLAFGGGTSLLKAHAIINRFSEDIDFKALEVQRDLSRSHRKEFRNDILKLIATDKDLTIAPNTVVSRNNSRFFACLIEYPKEFGGNISIRPQIKLEVTFSSKENAEFSRKKMLPIVGIYKDIGEHSYIPCIAPKNIMSDKISAFTWRVLNRDRESSGDDKTLIRHLYDISMLYNVQKENINEIHQDAQAIYLEDQKRGNKLPQVLSEALGMVVNILETDPKYKIEYTQFVTNMCFGKNNPVSFETAISTVRSMLEIK